jgi:hypothetical protein
VYGFCPVEELITEHTMSKATRSKTVMHHKLPAIKGKLDIINKVDTTVNVLCTKIAEYFGIPNSYKGFLTKM